MQEGEAKNDPINFWEDTITWLVGVSICFHIYVVILSIIDRVVFSAHIFC